MTLRKLRDRANLTGEQLGALTGINRSTIVNLEGGNRTFTAHYAALFRPHLGEDVWLLVPEVQQYREAIAGPISLTRLDARVELLEKSHDALLEGRSSMASDLMDTLEVFLRVLQAAGLQVPEGTLESFRDATTNERGSQ